VLAFYMRIHNDMTPSCLYCGRREPTKEADHIHPKDLARRPIPLTVVLVLLGLLVAIVPFVFLGFTRIIAHPLWVIRLLIALTLLFVVDGLRTAHLRSSFPLIRRVAAR
jgi:hypothetical protein